jgi:serine/threonine-protein kinase
MALLGNLGLVYAWAGQKDQAQKILDELKRRANEGYISPIAFVDVYIGLGEKDQAIEWLERGYEDRYPWINYIKINPRMDSLRSDPRFQELLRKMGLEK